MHRLATVHERDDQPTNDQPTNDQPTNQPTNDDTQSLSQYAPLLLK